MMRGLLKYILLISIAVLLFSQKARGGDSVDYLVVTSAGLKAGFDPLLEWKIRKGLKVEVITLDEISENYEGANIQLKIKQCLFEYHEQKGVKWVLLGGDHEVIPVQGCYSEVSIGGNQFEEFDIPTDLFYGCFEKRFDWNGLTDDKIGQMHIDGHDIIPEVYISRFPVQNLAQLGAMITKTLEYETNPPLTDFGDRMLLAGIKAWSSWDGLSDSHHKSELMYGESVPDEWKGEKLGFYDTGSDFPGGADYQLSAANLSDQLNSGYNFFHYAGHGSSMGLAMEGVGVFENQDASELDGPASGVMLSTTSEVNAFDSENTCFSEALLRNPKGGCVAFFGSSRYGFGDPEPKPELGPSFQYSAGFMKHLYDPDSEDPWKSFARVAAMAKNDFVYYGSAGGAFQYLLYAINPMGDPELPIYSGPISTFDRVRVYLMGDSLTVNTGGISHCRICLSSEDLEEGYQEVVENQSFHTFKNVPSSLQVTITAPDYKPYRRKFQSPTGLEGNIASFVQIYPNPVRDLLFLDYAFWEGHLQLYDLQGRLLLEQQLQAGTNVLDMSLFSKGPYFIHIQTEHGNHWRKLIKN